MIELTSLTVLKAPKKAVHFHEFDVVNSLVHINIHT